MQSQQHRLRPGRQLQLRSASSLRRGPTQRGGRGLCLTQCHAAVAAAACCYLGTLPAPLELLRRAFASAGLFDTPPHFIIQSAPHGATVWFTTVCALSVALAALSYNLLSILGQLQLTKTPPEQKRRVLHGVDVTNSRFFQDERVLAAVEFATQAHAGQVRKTGEPYVSHCVETALIVEHNLPPAGEYERHTLAIVAALLHDVVDDTTVELSAIKAKFGGQVASMVSQVSKLSQMNQLLRRGKRKGWAEYGPQHFKSLRKMIVDMVFEEPLVILVKLADRLHNMRTVFVLKPEKQRSVSEETLEVWCTMAECLGWDAMKSEMEDLCFAVLQPEQYCALRAQLDRIWNLPSLKVVLDQADSRSLPANALAPAPPLTSRGRKAAAATAARKAAAATKAAMRAIQQRTAMDAAALAAAGRGARPSVDNGDGDALDLGFKIVSQPRATPGSMVDEVVTAASVAALAAADATTLAAAAAPLPSAAGAARSGTGGGGAALSSASSALVSVRSAPHSLATAALLAQLERLQALEQVPPTAAPTPATALLSCGDATLTVPIPPAPPGQVWRLPLSKPSPSSTASSSSSTSTVSTSATSGTVAVLKPAAAVAATVRLASSPAASPAPSLSGVTAAMQRTATAATVPAFLSADEMELLLASEPPTPPLPSPPPPPAELPRSSLGLSAMQQALPTVVFTREQLAAGLPSSATAPAKPWVGAGTHGAAAAGQPVAATGLPAPLAGVMGALATTVAGAAVPHAVVLPPQQERLRSLVSTVVPFDSVNFKDSRGSMAMSTRQGLEVLDECAQLLFSEVQVRSSGGGLPLQIQGRLKSLHSVYRKMVRKGCSVAEVYDARALRVIVGDEGGARARDAVEACYKLVSTVHSIWKPIPQEFDDYIANPKPSGYQALHTAVRGPGGIPMEVQIKTSSMHELAEYGAAAHWVYKEFSHSSAPLPITTPLRTSPSPDLVTRPQQQQQQQPASGAIASAPAMAGSGQAAAMLQQRRQLAALAMQVERIKGRGWVGQPVLRVAKDKLRYGVVVSAEEQGKRLLVAVRAGPTSAQYPIRIPDYGFYKSLVEYVQGKGWTVPGHSDFNVRLEQYVLATDGRFHRKDHMGYVLPGEVITLLEGYEEDADTAWATDAAVPPTPASSSAASSPATAPLAAPTPCALTPPPPAQSSAPQQHQAPEQLQQHLHQPPQSSSSDGTSGRSGLLVDAGTPGPGAGGGVFDPVAERLRQQMQEAYLRTQQLRTVIQWGQEAMGRYHQGGGEPGEEVSVLIWPGGTIEHWPRGTTVAQLVRAKGIVALGGDVPEPPDIRPSATAVAGGDNTWGFWGWSGSGLAGTGVPGGAAGAGGLLGPYLQPAPAPPKVNVNNRLVPEDTVLNDGDLVILTREKVKI